MIRKILIIGLLCAYIDITEVCAFNLPIDIVKALENRDAKSVSKYFNSSIELNFTESQGIYGKAQAEQILKNFFDSNCSEKVTYTHLHTLPKDNAQFYIGELNSGKGLYRVYIHMKDRYIHQMRIESND